MPKKLKAMQEQINTIEPIYTYTLSDLLDSLTYKQGKEIKAALPKLFNVHRTTIHNYMSQPVGYLSATNMKILEVAMGRALPKDIDQFNAVELSEE